MFVKVKIPYFQFTKKTITKTTNVISNNILTKIIYDSYFADNKNTSKLIWSEIRFKDALIVGLFQILAFIREGQAEQA